MIPRRTHESNRCFSLPGGNEDNDLWVEIHRANVLPSDPSYGKPCITSVWVPSDEERRRISEGHNVAVHIIGTGQPPMHVTTTNTPLGKKPVT